MQKSVDATSSWVVRLDVEKLSVWERKLLARATRDCLKIMREDEHCTEVFIIVLNLIEHGVSFH